MVVPMVMNRHTDKLQNLCLMWLTLRKLANFVVGQTLGTVILQRTLYSPGEPDFYAASFSLRWMFLWKGCS